MKKNGIKLNAPCRLFVGGAYPDVERAHHQAPLEVMRQRTRRWRAGGKGKLLSRFTPSIGRDKQASESITCSAKQLSFAFCFSRVVG